MKKPSLNIYDFFNSPDVAEHCRSIGHTFNAVESAVMIYASNARTLAEKHAAYKAVIAELPDMSLPEGNNHGDIKSFHKALGEVIAYEKRVQKKLLQPEEGAFYQVCIHYKPSGLGEREIFSTYEKALAYALEEIDSYEVTNITRLRITKKYVDKYVDLFIDRKHVTAILSISGEIMSVDQDGTLPRGYDFPLLDTIYIDVPVPFKAGDLVEDADSDYYDGVYVLQNICRDHERHKDWLLTADRMDMTAWVYYESGGNVDCECMHFYPDLRYCRRPLAGEKRILKYVSLQMQKKMCLCSLLKIQKYLMLDKLIGEYKDDHELKHQLKEIDDGLLDRAKVGET